MAHIDASNADIINTVRANASLNYQQRIPATTKANLASTLSMIRENPIFWNEFMSTLINKIGLVVMDKNMTFENRLKPMKSGTMEYGGVVQELDAQLIQAHEYDVNETNVFKGDIPDVIPQYHRINRRNYYKMELNEDLLEEAVVNDGQLSAFLNSLMAIPEQSAEWDEYKLMLELLGMYQDTGSGFYNVQVADIATSSDKAADGRALTQKIRELYLYTKNFYRTQYNPEHAQAFSTELVLLTTPAVQSNLDVEVLANAFHMDKAEWLADRVVMVDEFPANLSGTQAMLIDNSFYRVYDTKRRNTSIYNPASLSMIFYYHIWQILSVSRVKNAIRLSTDASTGA